jgi:hypothetical protein
MPREGEEEERQKRRKVDDFCCMKNVQFFFCEV